MQDIEIHGSRDVNVYEIEGQMQDIEINGSRNVNVYEIEGQMQDIRDKWEQRG